MWASQQQVDSSFFFKGLGFRGGPYSPSKMSKIKTKTKPPQKTTTVSRLFAGFSRAVSMAISGPVIGLRCRHEE